MNWRKPTFCFLMGITGRPVSKKLRYLKSIEYKSTDELIDIQNEKLKKVLLHAFNNVSYYNQILADVGVVKDGQIYLENFSKIPILTKDIIRQQGQTLHSKDARRRKAYHNSSGGSTGQPVDILQDKEYMAWGMANRFLYDSWAGKDIGQPELKLWGSERDILQGKDSLQVKLRRWIFNTDILNAYKMSDQDMRMHIDHWNKCKPKMVWAYTESIYRLSKFVEASGMKVYAPKSIICTTSNLIPEMRQQIEKVFQCPAYNQYGSREVGPIASECPSQEGLHIFTTHQKLEVLDSKLQLAKDSQLGEIIITNLDNYSMPLIRYRIGDTGSLADKQCSCGRGLPMLKEVAGRVFSHFVKRDGSVIHAQFFVALLCFKPWVAQFKIIQKDYELIEILVAAENQPQQSDMDQISQKIKQVMGQDCKVEFKFVEEVPPTASGKYLYTVSEVAQQI